MRSVVFPLLSLVCMLPVLCEQTLVSTARAASTHESGTSISTSISTSTGSGSGTSVSTSSGSGSGTSTSTATRTSTASAPASGSITGWDALATVGAHVEAILEDGTTLVGTVDALDSESITLVTERFGTLVLTRAEVKSLRVEAPGSSDEPSAPGTGPGTSLEEPTVPGAGPAGSPIEQSTPGAGPATKERVTVWGTESEPVTPEPATRRRYENGWYVDPDYNSLLLVPTSETLPTGDSYYRNFELLFNNGGISLTDDVNLSFMAAFPVTSDFTVFGAGAKIRIVRRDEYGIGIAVAGSITGTGDEAVETISAIASVGDKRRSLSASINVGASDGDAATFVLAGADFQFAPRAKVLVEYGNSTEGFSDDEFYGIMNFGIRVFWETTSFTITGFRPLASDLDDFIAFPLVSFSAHF